MNAKSDRRPFAARSRRPGRSEDGFTMLETLMALVVMLIIMGGVMQSLLQLSRTQTTVWNRANMHGSVRSATELLQQEVGQAGRVSLPQSPSPVVTLGGAVSAGGAGTFNDPPCALSTPNCSLFDGEQLVVDAGELEETVTVSKLSPSSTATATFTLAHAAMAAVAVRGGFATGVVPCASQASCPGSTVATTLTNGSTGSVLKLYGDVNDDGNMVYVEYVCDTANGFLYRNMMPLASASKPAVSVGQVLLSNILPNPNGTACFTYDQKVVTGTTYVVNVAISLTTQTQIKDPTTRLFQTETKALLNVAPRNVFDAWQLASIGATGRIQPMPPSVTYLLH